MSDEEKKAEIVRLFESLTEPAPAAPATLPLTISGNSNVVGNNNTVFNTTTYRPKVRIDYHPDERHITPDQAAKLKHLVSEIVETEHYIKQRPKSYGAVYSALNQHFKVITYVLIAREDYDLAERYLRCWLGRLSSARSAPRKDPHWRERRRKYIFANTKGEMDERRRTYMLERFGTDAFTALDDSQVEQLYRVVASWKR